MFRHHSLKIKKPLGTNLEPQEVILDRLVRTKNREGYNQAPNIIRPTRKWGIRWWALFSLLIYFAFLGKVIDLQVAHGEYYRRLSAKNQFLMQSIQAERGVIYDDQGRQLVKNAASFSLVLDKKLFSQNPKANNILSAIAASLNVSPLEIKKKVENSSEQKVILASNLSHDSLLSLMSQINTWPGITIEKNLIRKYPYGRLLAHVLGYVSRQDQEGQAGLEKEYNDVLKDNPGLLKIQRDNRGEQLGVKIVREPSPGKSLILNIDLPLQQKITETLQKRMAEVHSSEGNAVAIDPNNGHILALVSLPTYDDNIFSAPLSKADLEKQEKQGNFSLFDCAISGIGYPTGSVIKPLIGLAALEEHIITPQTILPCPEKICLTNKYSHRETCYHDWKYHGPSDLRRAIAESINTYFYVIGGGFKNFPGLGPKRIEDWLQKFYWGHLTGIDLPQEGRGVLPNIQKNWHLGDTYHFSIGQGNFSVTPLQVAVAYGALANGGTLYQPQVVKSIVQEDKTQLKILKTFQPVVLASHLGHPKNIKVVREGMRQAVTSPHGSSHLLNDLPEAVASKTGTAQTGIKEHYHNWIAVFGPYEKPKIVLVLMLKDVPKSMVALRSTAKEILNWYFHNKMIN